MAEGSKTEGGARFKTGATDADMGPKMGKGLNLLVVDKSM